MGLGAAERTIESNLIARAGFAPVIQAEGISLVRLRRTLQSEAGLFIKSTATFGVFFIKAQA